MAAAILDIGKTIIRDALRNVAGNFITHVGVSSDSTAFAANQTALDPGGAGTNLIKAATFTVVAFDTLDVTITMDAAVDTGFVGNSVRTIGLMKGNTRTDVISRSVRSLGIGFQTGDVYTIGVRYQVQDNS